jgi:hypothetical protein
LNTYLEGDVLIVNLIKQWIKIVVVNSLFFLSDQTYVSLQYLLIYGHKISFSHPKTYSEKLTALKLRRQSVSKVVCSDKVTAKEFLLAKGYGDYLIPTIDIATSFEDIKWNDYPCPYIVKVSNGSSQSLIVDQQPLKFIDKLRFAYQSSMKHYIYGREWVYRQSKKQFIVEPFLTNDGLNLNDYKFHCFNGVPKFITINDNNLPDNARMMIDENYDYYPYPFATGKETIVPLPAKSLLDEMMTIAKDISKDHDFVRVDFYIVKNKVKIGELTFYPMAGYILRNSYEIDLLWGSYLHI